MTKTMDNRLLVPPALQMAKRINANSEIIPKIYFRSGIRRWGSVNRFENSILPFKNSTDSRQS